MLGLTLFRSMLVLPIAIPVIAISLTIEVAGFLGLATFVVAATYSLFALWRGGVWRGSLRLKRPTFF